MKLFDSTKNPQEWEIDNDLIEQMRTYEKEKGKSAIWRNKITKMFLYFKNCEDHPEFLEEKEKSKAKKKRKVKDTNKDVNIEVLEEKEVETEENMMLDIIEDYKMEFGVKRVNTNSKKFREFFEEWKKSN